MFIHKKSHDKVQDSSEFMVNKGWGMMETGQGKQGLQGILEMLYFLTWVVCTGVFNVLIIFYIK